MVAVQEAGAWECLLLCQLPALLNNVLESSSSMIPLELRDILTCAAKADYEYRCKA